MAARKQYQLPDPGETAPGFRLARLEGGEAVLSELLASGSILLVFYKITCPVCQFTLPFLERIHAQSAMPVYAISQNEPEDTREFNAEYGLTLPTLLDTEESGFPASNAYGISHVPTMFVVGVDGRIARVMEGWNKREMESLGSSAGVRVILPGEDVPAWKAG
jgi:peroxiredoxin